MHRPRTTPLAVAILASLAPGVSAQQMRTAPPEEVARSVLHADSAGDWAAVLRLAHPEALIRFRGRQVFQLRMLSTPGWPGADSAPAGAEGADTVEADSLDPDSSIQARWQRVRERQERFLLDSIFQVPDVDSLARTSPDTVYARWTRELRARSERDSVGPRSQERPSYRVVGAVKESDTLAYVVMVRPLEQPLGPLPEMFRDLPRETHLAVLMVMRRHRSEWRSMLDGVGESQGLNAHLIPE